MYIYDFLVDTITYIRKGDFFCAMKSFCIKTNNEEIIEYLLKNLGTSSLENIYFVRKSFKLYNNVIVHYTGNSHSHFLSFLSELLADCILSFYESILLKRYINFNYFYFDQFEKKLIEENCYKHIFLEEENSLKYRKEEIWTSVLQYISSSKSMILDGFVNFRLDNYYNFTWVLFKLFFNATTAAAAVAAAAAAAKSLQSCPTLCDPMDGSPPGSPVPGILQARTLEWVAISFSTA